MGFKSVINLRGAVPQASWYRSEIAVSQAHGVVHYDLPLSANSLVDPATMARITALLRSAPKPVLIHCQSGADRSGLVAAIYEYAIAARSPHRGDAYAACRYAIERVKQIAPIWKREFLDGGDVWIEGATADPDDARARAEAERVACV